MNASLGADFLISGDGGSGVGSYDDKAQKTTFTVGSLGGC
jgi:hypothetical protein